MSAPGHQWFHDVVSALCYSLAQPHEGTPQLEGPHNDLTRFILAQHSRMPDYLRAPIALATLGFDLAGAIRAGKRFHHQHSEKRQRQIARWKSSSNGFQRDLIRYYESLATLALYSRGQGDSNRVLLGGQATGGEKEGIGAGGRADPGTVIDAPSRELRAAIVVIGSGPGGAITACLLAEAGREVLLIEEGPFLPLESCAPFSMEEMLQKYRSGGQTVALGRSKIAYVEGCCVGGGSEINSGLYHRTPADVLERWRREFGVEALSEGDLVPHFEACERELSVSPLPGPAAAASLKLHDGASRLGWKSLEVPRWFRYETTAEETRTGKRQSMTETYIGRFLRAGGRLLPCSRARRLERAGGMWRVAVRHKAAGPIQVSAGTVFLCGGAVQSPALLRRSGITRNIGDSLQVHPTVKVVARFEDEINAEEMGVPVHQVKEFAPRLSLGCSISSPAYVALGLIDHPEAARWAWRDWRNLAVYYAMITSEGRGSVRAMPGYRDAVVRYRLTESDRRNLADGLRRLSQSLFEAGATALYPSLTRGPVLRCAGHADKLPDALPEGLANLMTIHLFSSCPMGEDERRCGTDSFGRLHGFSDLFLNDASLLCTAPGVNPQGTIMALARRNTLHYLDGHAAK